MKLEDLTLSDDHSFISTGHLPFKDQIHDLVKDAYLRFASDRDGDISNVYPALAAVDPDLFGISVCGVNGDSIKCGNADDHFSIMSVSKPFLFALVCAHLGHRQALNLIGANSTGLPFNSLTGVEASRDGRTNPMVNSGAIATTSLVPGDNPARKWSFIHEGMSRFAGRDLQVNSAIYRSAQETNYRNRAIANMLRSRDCIYCDPIDAVDLYTRQCALDVSAFDLAVMGATLADGGVNPITRARVIPASICHYTLAVMATAGMYETSGDWLYEVGLPGKSGIGGGIVAVAPGKGAIGTFGPRLDAAGNSVKGQLAVKYLSQKLGMGLFASRPEQ
ncbi:glutaminase A [Paracoccus aminophilus]|nr:glutaminase A [Paracoccus aminophilus]